MDKRERENLITFTRHLLPILSIPVLSFALYANSLSNGFVYDDNGTIVNNTLIKNLANLPELVRQSYFAGSGELTYRPVVSFTYFMDYALHGPKPWGFHLTNILLHAVNGLLLYIFLLQICGQLAANGNGAFTSPAFIASALFVSHPALIEAVNAVSYREDLLSFLFYMGAMNIYLFLRSHARHKYKSYLSLCALSYLFYFFALLSKEMALTLPLAIYCHEMIYRDNKAGAYYYILISRYYIGYIAVTLMYIFIRFYYFKNPVNAELPSWSLFERFLTVPWLLASYLRLSLFPVFLSADYVINPVKSCLSYRFFLPLLVFIISLGAAFRFGMKQKGVLFGSVFFILTLLPVYNIAPIPNPFAERYLYLPTAGLIIVLASVIQTFSTDRIRSLFMYMSIAVLLGLFSLIVVMRNTVWNSELSLWSDTVRKMPDSRRAHNILGAAYFGRGRLNEAISEYMTALKLDPNYIDALNNLGNAYYSQGRLDDAVAEYTAALKMGASDASLHNNIGNALYSKGLLDDAVNEYMNTLKLNPLQVDARSNLGLAYYSKGLLDEAIDQYITALKLNPDHANAHSNLGLAYYSKGLIDEAIDQYITALKLNPVNADTHFNLGNAYRSKGLIIDAGKEFEITLMLRPDYLPARESLSLINTSK